MYIDYTDESNFKTTKITVDSNYYFYTKKLRDFYKKELNLVYTPSKVIIDKDNKLCFLINTSFSREDPDREYNTYVVKVEMC